MDVDQNKQVWEKQWDWTNAGEEWSAPFGGSAWEWHWCIRPRLMSLLPCSAIVEIAPGYGRWTRFLTSLCQSYVGVDLAGNCVDACNERFKGRERTNFVLGSGCDLPGVEDQSIDLVFSYDSLVHVEATEMRGYVSEIRRVLRPGGHAFVHYSNMLDVGTDPDEQHLRAPTMGSSLMREFVAEESMFVEVEETFPSGDSFINALSLIVNENANGRQTRSLRNARFSHVTTYIRDMSELWRE